MNTAPEVIYDFDPRNLPPDLLRAIGLMAAASAHTESVLQHFIGGLLGIDALEALALTTHMSAPLKDSVARALIELNGISAETIDQVDDLLDAIKDATAARNVVVHNSFARHPETGEVFSYRESARGSLQISLQPVRVEQIEKDAALIYEAGMDLMRFMLVRQSYPVERTRSVHIPLNRKKDARVKRREARKALRS